MAQRQLKKLDVLKQYEKKRLRKYDMIECRNLGKVQFNPFVRTPLTFDFKMDYETSWSEKSAISATLFNQHVIQHSQSTVQPRQRSESTLTMKKKYFGKPAVRPFSAPACLKHKPTYQRGNLQALDGCFMILKLHPKLKPSHSTAEVQKRRVPEEHIIVGTGSREQQPMVTVEKGDQLSANQSTILNVERNQRSQELGSESEVKLSPNGNLLPDVLSGSNLLKDNLTTEGGRTEKDYIYSKETLQKKKPIVPLCIEDEIEKPNAKIITAGCPRPKCESPRKMSESFPVFTRNDVYMENYILNRWLAVYGSKALHYIDPRNGACRYLNPVLQNNYNESIAIIGSKEPPPPPPLNVTVKRKKKPMLSGKPKRITIQILSVEKAPSNIYVSSKKKAPFVQKTNVSVAETININTIMERKLMQSMLMGSKDTLMIQGVNLKGTHHPSTSSTNLISRTKSQVPLRSVEDARKKGRMIFVDYIPISKPIPVQRCGCKLSALYSSTKVKSSETKESLVCHYDEFDQKPYQDENQTADMEVKVLSSRSLVQNGSDSSRRLVSSTSLKVFPEEINNGSRKSGIMATRSEQLHIVPTRSDIISIPTAQFDAAESHKDRMMKDFNATL